MALIVSLDEFAELCGVTSETMRVHLRDVGKDGADVPAWLIERGDRGRAYKIEAEGGVEWWRARREAEELASKDRLEQLSQMRLELVGQAADQPFALEMSGRQRKEEYEASMAAIRYRKALGQLVEKASVERVLTAAAVEHRRQLQQLPAEYGIAAGLGADQVRMLEEMLERRVAGFVDTITAADAFQE